jgi:uncharacterized phiE125 gp8 family phage protein
MMILSAGVACAAPAAPPACGAGLARADAIVPPTPAVAAAKAYLRIDGEAEDAMLATLVSAAIGHGEAFTGQMLIARGVAEMLPASPAWRRLARTPVRAITGIEMPEPDAEPLPVDSHAFDIDAGGDGWVRLTAPIAGERAQLRYVAGLAETWETLPEPIRQGVIRLASHLYAHRDAAEEGAPPAAVAALWRPWRRMRLA